jgi:hypothetical protein
MLEEFIGQKVVIDLRSPYVCVGTLAGLDELHLEVRDADLHDLRDTHTSRENYIVSAVRTGIKRNRRTVHLARREVVAIARLKDVVED